MMKISPPRDHAFFFFFNDTATTEIYTLSLHDALPIFLPQAAMAGERLGAGHGQEVAPALDRKSTRLNSSHANISYAVFCLKKKKAIEGVVGILIDSFVRISMATIRAVEFGMYAG